MKTGGKSRIILIFLVALLCFGCSHTLKFNAKKAQQIKEYTVIAMDTVQDVLISWPFYSGWIKHALDPYRGQLPIPPEFWEAISSLDELAKNCPAVTDPNPGEKCDFSEWQPELLVTDITNKTTVRFYPGEHNGSIFAEFGPRIVYEGKKRTEYGTGYAAGDLTVMCSSIILKTLKYVKQWVPEAGKILKYLAVLL